MHSYPLFCLSLIASAALALVVPDSRADSSPMKVVLKLDDTRAVNGQLPEGWRRVDEFCAQRKIPYSVGVICKSLEGDNPAFIASLRAIAESGRAELWNHGYDHKQWNSDGAKISEFKDSGYAHQLEHLKNAQTLAKKKLGVTLTAFGAPFNATDEDTLKALAQIPELKVWLFGPRDVNTKLFVAVRSANLEQPVSKPNFAAFKRGYAQHKSDPYMVLQGHPTGWSDEDFTQFVSVVDFLQSEGVTFVFPRDLPGS